MQARARSKNTTNKNLSPKDLLEKGMNPKNWKFKTDNKMRGAFGETDFSKGVVRVNKKRHKQTKYKGDQRNPDGSESLLNTIVHEDEHVKDPKATEKDVVRRAKQRIKKLSTKQKSALYARFQK